MARMPRHIDVDDTIRELRDFVAEKEILGSNGVRVSVRTRLNDSSVSYSVSWRLDNGERAYGAASTLSEAIELAFEKGA